MLKKMMAESRKDNSSHENKKALSPFLSKIFFMIKWTQAFFIFM